MLEPEHVFNGRYRVDVRLGAGGMAIVYSGTDLLLRRRVAIKVLRDQFTSDRGFVQRFSYEAQAAAKLSHPNVVNVYDFGQDGDAYFIVMELVEGTTLAEMLRDERTIPESVAIDYATQIAAGLAYAHRQGLLHRDVKPANILVTEDDVVKLSDFGIARAVAENVAAVTQPGMVMGSVAYVSPEQAQGQALDERSDLYALGVVLYQMLAGRLPFAAETPVALALKHVSEPPPPLASVARVSPALAAVVDRLLEKNPTDRFSSAADLARALREAREQPAMTFAGSRSFADEQTAPMRHIGARQLPPRPSAAPDRPGTNGRAAPVADARQRRRTNWGPLIVVLALATVAGYVGARYVGVARTIPVADFSAQSVSIAQQQVVAAGLRPDVHLEASASVPVDRVIHQDPAPGTLLARNDVVTLYVSSGAPLATIPDIQGFVRADAERALANAKFTSKIVQRYDRSPKDTVVNVVPSPGQQAPEGSTVTVVVSQGLQPVRVPQLVGLSLDDARARLAELGLKLNVDQETPSDMIPKDTIASQGAAVDTLVDPGSTVGVTLSTGPMLTTVPDVSGKAAADAGAALTAAGFQPRVQYIVDASGGNGNVVAEDPAAGTTEPRQSTVTISVAVSGTVPDVTGMTLDGATAALADNGYNVGPLTPTNEGPEGRVSHSDPPAGTPLRPGESVALTYHPVGLR